MSLVVQKFGGTSVATVERIQRVAQRIARTVSEGCQAVVTVSAMGKTTDELSDLATAAHPHPHGRELDMLLSAGEQMSMAVLAMALENEGCSAVSLTGWQAGIQTDRAHGNARITHIETENIEAMLKEHQVVIVAGFQGVSEEGQVTTLGRGGSDTTAVALAAALNAGKCEIYTDVDGVFTCDPRYVDDAQKMESLSYDEMLELATLGAGVLHPRAVEFAKNDNVILEVRSSLHNESGTIIKEETSMENDSPIRGLAFETNVSKMTLCDLPNDLGTLPGVFSTLAAHGINVDIIIQTINDDAETINVSFSVDTADLDLALETLYEHQNDLSFREVTCENDLAKVSIVGSGMISHPGIAAQMFQSLSGRNIYVKMVSTSEIKVSTVILRKDLETALDALHKAFELGSETAVSVTS